MTAEDLRSQLDRVPFIPIRVHLVSGKTVDILSSEQGNMLQNAVMVFQPRSPREADSGYNVIALRNIEMIEQLAPSATE
jgi:hypothetical protein